MRSIICLAAVCAVGSAASADLVEYTFTGTVDSSSISSGDFSGAAASDAVSVVFVIDTDHAPGFTNANNSFWDGVAGMMQSMSVTIGGVNVSAAPNDAPTRLRVVDDNVSGSGNVFDQFWIEASPAAPGAFSQITTILSSIVPSGLAPSSIMGTDLPTDSSDIIVGSFTNENNIILYGPTGPGDGLLFATITGFAAQIVPAPSAAAMLGLGLIGGRRRR